jgi:hypothetical protein
MKRSERIYRALLRAYPQRTRDATGDDMAQLFTDRLRDARSTREVAVVWVESVADLAKTAPRERLVARRSRQLVEGPAVEPERVPMKRDAALASVPVAISLLLAIWNPGVFGAMTVNPPGMFGLPLGMAILVAFGMLASLGILAARRNHELNDPWHQALILLVLLVPAPALAVISSVMVASFYALGATLFLLVARFRLLMLALVAAFLVWLVVGPFVMGIVVPIMQGLGEAP